VFMHVCVNTLYVCMYVFMHGASSKSLVVGRPDRPYVCMYSCMYVCIHVCIYVCMYVCCQ
jgi:hypothetical protein